MNVIEQLSRSRVVPVAALDRPEDAVPLCSALQEGGVEVIEFAFRTESAAAAIRLVSEQIPNFLVGAGTVLTLDELERATDAGAKFAVAPGLDPTIVKRAQALELPFFPGVCTPTDITGALALGCSILKFFPAETVGGIPALKAVAGPFAHRKVKFVVTGGVDGTNAAKYLALPEVLAVGGMWLAEKALIKAGAWKTITQRARELTDATAALSH